MRFEVEIEAYKSVKIEANDEVEAREKASELPLEITDFDWNFTAQEIEEMKEVPQDGQ